MEFTNSFGKFLEQLRGKLSLRKAATKSGLSHAYIRDLELGRNRSTNDVIKPSPDTLRKLSQAYDFSYTELLIKAGYLEEEPCSQSLTEFNLRDVWYVEFGTKDIRYHMSDRIDRQNVDSLLQFTSLLETLQDHDFIKLDTHLFVNLRKIKKYAPQEGKLYFDSIDEGKFVTMAMLAQRKFHLLLMEAVAANSGTQPSVGTCPQSLKPKLFS